MVFHRTIVHQTLALAVYAWMKRTHLTVPLLSDGVGRSGTFICVHSQLERLKTEGVVDIFQCIKSARIQRAGLVPEAVSGHQRDWSP